MTTAQLDAARARLRATWSAGDYAAVAQKIIPDLGGVVVEAAEVRAGDRVLDVASGAGNAALPAAARGADVVAADITPDLLAAGQAEARRRGLAVEWAEVDAAALPYADGEFDVVLSCVGVMFVPDQQAAAGELLRVCKDGGRIALLSWTPTGFVGDLLRAVRPYAPPAAPGARPPVLWGDEDHVRSLLGGGVTAFTATRGTVTVDGFASPAEWRDWFADRYGPVRMVRAALAATPDRVSALDTDLADLARRYDRGTGRTVMDWEYLLVTARRGARS